METAKKRRPFGFYVCSMGFTFERLAFYTVKYLLAIWIATDVADLHHTYDWWLHR